MAKTMRLGEKHFCKILSLRMVSAYLAHKTSFSEETGEANLVSSRHVQPLKRAVDIGKGINPVRRALLYLLAKRLVYNYPADE